MKSRKVVHNAHAAHKKSPNWEYMYLMQAEEKRYQGLRVKVKKKFYHTMFVKWEINIYELS